MLYKNSTFNWILIASLAAYKEESSSMVASGLGVYYKNRYRRGETG